MTQTLTLLLVGFLFPCVTGQSMESIPSTPVVKRPGETLSLSCRGSGFTFTCCTMNWVRQQPGKALEWIGESWSDSSKNSYASSLRGRIEVSRDDSNSLTYLRLSNLKPEDSAVYYCAKRGSNAFDYWGKGTMVTVTTATSTAPTVFPLVPCSTESGDMVTLGCLATGFNPPAVTFSWTKGGAALTDFIQYPSVQKGNVYTGVSQVQVRKQDWDTRQNVQCVVNHAAGNAQTPIPPPPLPFKQNPTLKVFSSSSDEDRTYTASCFAKEFAPKKHNLKWLKNGADITSTIDLTETVCESKNAAGKTVYNAVSFLTVNSSDLNDQTKFMCLFTGGEDASLNKTVAYKDNTPDFKPCSSSDVKAQIFGPTTKDMLLNKKGTITCKVMAENKKLNITWEDEEGNDMASKPITPVSGVQNSYKSELDITYDEWTNGVKRFCVVHHQDLIEPLREPYKRDFDFSIMDSLEFRHPGLSGEDNIASVAIVFILLFLITLLLIFGTTVIKVK